MARRQAKARATEERILTPVPFCWACQRPTRVVYHGERRITHLEGMCRYTLVVRRCQNRACVRYGVSVRPEEEGSLALPQGEFGLDVIALVGQLRFGEHRSMAEIHQALRVREVNLAPRTVTNLVQRYEELLALQVADPVRLADRLRLRRQERVVLAIDGLQPDQGHEVLWVLRDVLSGTVLLARSLLGARAADLVPLLREVATALPVPITAVISDGQRSIRNAVRTALPGVPHQLCQFHYLREAAKPLVEADRHAAKDLKKRVRGVRPIERALEARTDGEAAAVRGYCLAVRSALTDAGHPPLDLPGVQFHARLSAIDASLERVVEKGGPAPN
jgi:Transposase, Mutator family